MTALLHVADRVFNRPLLIHPEKAEVILYALRERLGLDLDIPSPEASRFIGARRKPDGGGTLVRQSSGVGIITITGSLVNRGAWLDASSGVTSYEGIAAQIREAADDPGIETIVLDLDSPGGEAGGMVGLANLVREARSVKRVVAVVDDFAASAAYGIASAADEIVISPTSVVGSIGVVLLHLDRSGELEAKGVKPTLIHAGAHKVDGNPFGPLPEAVRADLQASVDQFYSSFLDTVAAGRGVQNGRRGRTLRTLSADKARATEARTFLGQEALERGLADRIGTLASVLADYSTGRRASSRASQGNVNMNHPTDMVSAADHQAAITAAVEAERSKAAAATAAAVTAARAEGVAEERARVDAILGSEEAKGREAQATALVKTGASAEMAKSVLAASPKSAGTIADRFAATGTLSPIEGNAPDATPKATINSGEIFAARRAAVDAAHK